MRRQDLWRGAEMLEALASSAPLPARYRAWPDLDRHPPFDWDDVAEAAHWPAPTPADLPAFLCCVGAATHAATWRVMLDGEQLRRLADRVSAPLLDAVLALDLLSVPEGLQQRENALDETGLIDLGRRLLVAALPGPALRDEAADFVEARASVEVGAALFARLGARNA